MESMKQRLIDAVEHDYERVLLKVVIDNLSGIADLVKRAIALRGVEVDDDIDLSDLSIVMKDVIRGSETMLGSFRGGEYDLEEDRTVGLVISLKRGMSLWKFSRVLAHELTHLFDGENESSYWGGRVAFSYGLTYKSVEAVQDMDWDIYWNSPNEVFAREMEDLVGSILYEKLKVLMEGERKC
jgi:hypothetical protein